MTSSILHALLHFIQCHVQSFGQFCRCWWTLKFLLQTGKSFVDLVDGTNLVQRKSNDSALLCKRLKNGLTDPPYRIRDELESTRLVKTLGCLDQAKVAFVDQIRKGQPLVLVLLGHRHDKTKVGLGQLLEGKLVPSFDFSGELHLFLCRDEVHTTNFLEVFVKRRCLSIRDLLGDF